jgi:hypothetical protein
MTTDMIPATTQTTDEKRGMALLKAVGLDKVAPEQREIALALADRYELDLLLGHLQLIDGKPYVTHKGLLHVGHRSGVLDGIEDTTPVLEGGFWRCTSTVWRKDMTRGFAMPGRYPERGKNASYGPEMAMVRAECLALRRAFDVAAPVAEERWAEQAEAEVTEPVKAKSLTELARLRAAAVEAPLPEFKPAPAQEAPQQPQEPEAPSSAADEPIEATAVALCDAKSDPKLGDVEDCSLPAGHESQPGPRRHQSAAGTVWPVAKGGAK